MFLFDVVIVLYQSEDLMKI